MDSLTESHEVDHKTAFKMLKKKMYDDLKKNGMDNVKLFLVDNRLWQRAIVAHEKGNYKQAGTPYDEDELIRFVIVACQLLADMNMHLQLDNRQKNLRRRWCWPCCCLHVCQNT